jgi:GDP-D-mannose dehydratase
VRVHSVALGRLSAARENRGLHKPAYLQKNFLAAQQSQQDKFNLALAKVTKKLSRFFVIQIGEIKKNETERAQKRKERITIQPFKKV